MVRLALAGVSVLALAACNSITYDPQRFKPVASNVESFNNQLVDERARVIADDLGVTVQSVHVQPRVTERQNDDGDEDRLSDGYVAWLKVAECERGHLVINADDFAVPTQAFTRYGCSLEGLPSY